MVRVGRKVVLWFLLVLICAGLGYPTLNRYDPRIAIGVNDSAEYYSLVTSADFIAARSLAGDSPRPRILVPFVARFIYRVADGHTRSADPVLFGLLIANALFCATAALMLVDLGSRALGNYPVALLGATLYLLSFAVPNYHLSGMVDSGEACLMLALVWAMYAGRWFLLPLIGIIGACAKETFVPFSGTFTLVWWLLVFDPAGRTVSRLGWIVAMDIAALGAMILLWSAWYGELIWPWNIALVQHYRDTTFLQGLWGCISSHELLYVFGWLAPLGVWKLNRLPAPWVAASLVTALLALAMGAWDNGAGNVTRAMFNAAAPVLSLSVAMLLSGSIDTASPRNAPLNPETSEQG